MLRHTFNFSTAKPQRHTFEICCSVVHCMCTAHMSPLSTLCLAAAICGSPSSCSILEPPATQLIFFPQLKPPHSCPSQRPVSQVAQHELAHDLQHARVEARSCGCRKTFISSCSLAAPLARPLSCRMHFLFTSSAISQLAQHELAHDLRHPGIQPRDVQHAAVLGIRDAVGSARKRQHLRTRRSLLNKRKQTSKS